MATQQETRETYDVVTLNYEGSFATTETTVHVFGHGAGVRVTVRMLPGFTWWTCPDAATLRRLVDDALRGTTFEREGRRDPEGYQTSQWGFRYWTRPIPGSLPSR